MKPIARLFSILAVLGLLLPLLAACGEAPATPTTGVSATATGGVPADAQGATATAAGPGANTTPAEGAAPGGGTTAGAPATEHVMRVWGGPATTTWLRDFNPFHGNPRFPTIHGIHEPMMIWNTLKGELVPWLATEYEWSEDLKTLTFTLREGVKWSDGQPFSAADVAFTFNFFRDKPGLQGPGLQGMNAASGYVDTVTAPDAKTVVFSFKRVYTPGFYDIINQNIVPEHIWKDVADPSKFTNDNPVGTGPFTQVTDFKQQIYQVDRNPHYWQADKIKVNGLRYPAFATPDAQALALANGELDWAGILVPNVEQTFVAKDPANRGYYFPGILSMVLLGLNTTVEPFDDPNVRKAISMAINRDQINKVANYGYFRNGDVTGLTDAFPQWKVQDASKLGDWTTFNTARANEMLDAAGLKKGGDGIRTLPDGTRMQYTFTLVGTFANWNAGGQVIIQNLKEVGIGLTMQPFDFPGYLDKVQKGDFQVAFMFSAVGATPFNLYRGVLSSDTSAPIGEVASQNFIRYESEKGEELLNQFASTADVEEQKQIAIQLQELFAAEAPALPLWPGPAWYEYNQVRFTGFPTKDNLYAQGNAAGQNSPEALIVMTNLRPR